MGDERDELISFALAKVGSDRRDAEKSFSRWWRETGSGRENEEKNPGGLALLMTLIAFSLRREGTIWSSHDQRVLRLQRW